MGLWCMNYLSITGDDAVLTAFDKQFYKIHKKYEVVRCNKPESECGDGELSMYIATKTVPHPSYEDSDEQGAKFYTNCIISETVTSGYSFHNFIPITMDDYLNTSYQRIDLLEEAAWGDNGFSLRCKNGKSVYGEGARDWYIRDGLIEEREIKTPPPGQLSYVFSTDYKPPLPVIEEMSRQYPGLSFEFKYDASRQCAGFCILKNGEYIVQDFVDLHREELINDEENQRHRQLLHKHKMAWYVKCPGCGWSEDPYHLNESTSVKCNYCGEKMPGLIATLHDKHSKTLNLPIEELGLSLRGTSWLKREGITTIRDILPMSGSDLSKIYAIVYQYERIENELLELGVAHLRNREYSNTPVTIGLYKHYEGGEFEVKNFGKHGETHEGMVIYTALHIGGTKCILPSSMWDDMVEVNGRYVQRFKKI